MYKWPEQISPTAFGGLTIESIQFTVNTITIGFDRDVAVTVESSIQLNDEQKTEEVSIPPSNTGLLCLLGKKVTEAVVDDDAASLLLRFEKNLSIRIEGGDAQYECFHISTNGKEFIV